MLPLGMINLEETTNRMKNLKQLKATSTSSKPIKYLNNYKNIFLNDNFLENSL